MFSMNNKMRELWISFSFSRFYWPCPCPFLICVRNKEPSEELHFYCRYPHRTVRNAQCTSTDGFVKANWFLAFDWFDRIYASCNSYQMGMWCECVCAHAREYLLLIYTQCIMCVTCIKIPPHWLGICYSAFMSIAHNSHQLKWTQYEFYWLCYRIRKLD